MDTRESSVSAPSTRTTDDHRPARLYACSGCGERFAGRELVELHEGNHDDLTYFHGDQLCRECADGTGVAY